MRRKAGIRKITALRKWTSRLISQTNTKSQHHIDQRNSIWNSIFLAISLKTAKMIKKKNHGQKQPKLENYKTFKFSGKKLTNFKLMPNIRHNLVAGSLP